MMPDFKEMAREWFGDVHGGVLNAYASALQSAYEAGRKDERERCAGLPVGQRALDRRSHPGGHAMTWQSIETAPIARLEFDPMNEFILVGRKGEVPRVVSYEQGTWYLAEGQGGCLLYEPTHWMHLDQPETKS